MAGIALPTNQSTLGQYYGNAPGTVSYGFDKIVVPNIAEAIAGPSEAQAQGLMLQNQLGQQNIQNEIALKKIQESMALKNAALEQQKLARQDAIEKMGVSLIDKQINRLANSPSSDRKSVMDTVYNLQKMLPESKAISSLDADTLLASVNEQRKVKEDPKIAAVKLAGEYEANGDKVTASRILMSIGAEKPQQKDDATIASRTSMDKQYVEQQTAYDVSNRLLDVAKRAIATNVQTGPLSNTMKFFADIGAEMGMPVDIEKLKTMTDVMQLAKRQSAMMLKPTVGGQISEGELKLVADSFGDASSPVEVLAHTARANMAGSSLAMMRLRMAESLMTKQGMASIEAMDTARKMLPSAKEMVKRFGSGQSITFNEWVDLNTAKNIVDEKTGVSFSQMTPQQQTAIWREYLKQKE